MGLNIQYIFGQTPIDEEEKEGLKIPAITTKKELDEFEQKNIEQAVQWTIGRKIKVENILTESFVKLLHKRMFNDVWQWAGEFRKTEKNLGVKSSKISVELRKLLDDTRFWIENKTFSKDEIAIRFKHRLVSIHCFPNGNGRHSRLMADIIAEKIFNRKIFTWGMADAYLSQNDARIKYIKALKKADKGSYTSLRKFARS